MEERRRDYIDLHERVASQEAITTEIRDDVRELKVALLGNGHDGVLDKIEARVGSLEASRTWLKGIAAAISAGFAILMTILGLRGK